MRVVEMAGVIGCAVAWMVWNQPVQLFRVAALIERAVNAAVRRMRIHAAAQQDSRDTYKRSYAWYLGRTAGGNQ